MEILLQRSSCNPDLSSTLVTSAILHNILSRIPSNTYFDRVPDNSLIAVPVLTVSPPPPSAYSPLLSPPICVIISVALTISCWAGKVSFFQ